MPRFLLFICLSLYSLSTLADLIDKGFTAEYELSLMTVYIGTATRQLDAGDKQLTYQSVAKPDGLAKMFVSDIITETSHMDYRDGLITPRDYRYRQSGGDEETDEQVKFRQKDKIVALTRENKTFPLEKNSYDVLSFQLALMRELQQQHKHFVFHVADHRNFHTFHAKVAGEETLSTPAGDFKVVKVDARDPDSGKRFVFWCAEKLDYLPVRVEYTKKKDGDVSALMLKSINIDKPL